MRVQTTFTRSNSRRELFYLRAYQCPRYQNPGQRGFSSSHRSRQRDGSDEPFGSRLRRALRGTKITWYPIPVGLGIGFLGLGQLYKVREREKLAKAEDDAYLRSVGSENGGGQDGEGRPKRRERIRPSGPWYTYELKAGHRSGADPRTGRFKSCLHFH
jgi:hypothetical protein